MLADLHASTLSLCRERVGDRLGRDGSAPSFVRLDGAALPFSDDSFDIAVSDDSGRRICTCRLTAQLRDAPPGRRYDAPPAPH